MMLFSNENKLIWFIPTFSKLLKKLVITYSPINWNPWASQKKWSHAYLTERKQQVLFNSVSSSVSLESHLGPLLFVFLLLLIFLLIYANDVKIFHTINSTAEVESLQPDPKEITAWCFKNGMLLNQQKCKKLSFLGAIY